MRDPIAVNGCRVFFLFGPALLLGYTVKELLGGTAHPPHAAFAFGLSAGVGVVYGLFLTRLISVDRE